MAPGSDIDEPYPELDPTWVDLLDVDPSDVVLLVQRPGGPAEGALRRCSLHVTVIDHDRIGEVPAGPWDLICVDDVRLEPDARRGLRGRLAPEGRWAEVCDNAVSPLRILDCLLGRPHGSTSRPGPVNARRAVAGKGWQVQQMFVLLRSTRLPYTAFDLTSASGPAVVVDMTISHVGGVRAWALRRLVLRGAATAGWLAPGWLLVASVEARHDTRARIVGQVGNRDSTEIKIVHGDPPVAVERRSASGPRPAELRILRELDLDGFDLAPRVVAESRHSATYSWLHGSPLAVDTLDDDDLVEWTGRAAALLSRLQGATRLEDGSVVVHGDFWLGNVLVHGTEITGLVDWGDARRGSAEIDRRFLLESLVRRLDIAPELARRLADSRDAELPGRATPDPAAYIIGEHADLVTLPAHVRVHRVVELPNHEVLLALAAEWVRTEPTPPILLPASRDAARLLCELRAGLVERGLLVPELSESATEVSESVGYHAFVDHEGTVVADFATRRDPDADAVEVSRRADVVVAGRAVVHDRALRGPLTVWLDESGSALSELGVDACLGPWAAVGAQAGMDIAGAAYADLAGIARPRIDLRPGLYALPLTTPHRRPSRPGGRATNPPGGRGGRPAGPDRGGDPS